LVEVSTATVAVPRVAHARPHRFARVTLIASEPADVLVRVPLRTTVTLGLHVGPVGDGFPAVAGVPLVSGFPFPAGGAAAALDTPRATRQRATSTVLSFIRSLLFSSCVPPT
jgi:hypothetical protein